MIACLNKNKSSKAGFPSKYNHIPRDTSVNIRARDLKNMGKYGSGLSCRWALFTA